MERKSSWLHTLTLWYSIEIQEWMGFLIRHIHLYKIKWVHNLNFDSHPLAVEEEIGDEMPALTGASCNRIWFNFLSNWNSRSYANRYYAICYWKWNSLSKRIGRGSGFLTSLSISILSTRGTLRIVACLFKVGEHISNLITLLHEKNYVASYRYSFRGSVLLNCFPLPLSYWLRPITTAREVPKLLTAITY